MLNKRQTLTLLVLCSLALTAGIITSTDLNPARRTVQEPTVVQRPLKDPRPTHVQLYSLDHNDPPLQSSAFNVEDIGGK